MLRKGQLKITTNYKDMTQDRHDYTIKPNVEAHYHMVEHILYLQCKTINHALVVKQLKLIIQSIID